MLKKKGLRVGLLVLAVVGMLPLTAGAAQAATATTSKCINGTVTVSIPGRPMMTFPALRV